MDIFWALIFYAIAALPGIGYARAGIAKDKLSIRHRINDLVTVGQYKSFIFYWWILALDVVKVLLFIGIVWSVNLLWSTAFILGIAYPIWLRFKPRYTGLFPILIILQTNIWLGLAFIALFAAIWFKFKPYIIWFKLFMIFICILLFWALNVDIFIVLSCVVFFVVELSVLGITLAKRER